MKNVVSLGLCAAVLTLAMPLGASAQERGNHGGGAPARGGAPPARAAAPPAAAPQRAMPPPQARAAAPAGGFNLRNDLPAARAAVPAPVVRQAPAIQQARPVAPQAQPVQPVQPVQAARPQYTRPVTQGQPRPVQAQAAQPVQAERPQYTRPVTQQQARPVQPVAQQRPAGNRAPAVQSRTTNVHVAANQRVAPKGVRPPSTYRRAPQTVAYAGGPYRGKFNGRTIRNGHLDRGNYSWNHGVRWSPASAYWGGGFWGDYGFSGLAAELLFGSILDSQNGVYYPSYEVEPDSPGAQLLADYNLQQTPCGQPDLVAVWGPDNSVICAYPNESVGPGNYEVDPATFELVSTN
jgi:hypothetical protein